MSTLTSVLPPRTSPLDAGERKQRGKLEALRLPAQPDRRLPRVAAIDLQLAPARSAQHRGGEQGRVEPRVAQRDVGADALDAPAVGQREALDRQVTVGVESLQQCEVDGIVGEHPRTRRQGHRRGRRTAAG